MLFCMLELIFFSLTFVPTAFNLVVDPSNLIIIVLSQKENFHVAQAASLEADIINQAKELEKMPPQVILTHSLDIYGSWTIVPVIAYLKSQQVEKDWYIFCTEYTVIKLRKLIQVLGKYTDFQKNHWLGHALYDKEPTIIHHFAEHAKKFKYPHLSSGFAISKHLFKSLARKASDVVKSNIDFTVDASYEFSTFVLNESKGVRLTHEPGFCTVSGENCAAYPNNVYPCKEIPKKQNMYFAVKTCAMYHKERLAVIRKTWGKYAKNIGFFTDELDEILPDGHIVPKTDQGHCTKTYGILKYAALLLEEKNLDWLIVTDDDTLLSVPRLQKLLTCYNPKNTIALGERYGYRTTKIHGYDYLTGGSGVVLSRTLVEQIIKPGVCECPSATTPDDMFLFGVCLAHLGIGVTHSPLFHQARPTDYASSFIASQEPISFHKFWMLDPEQVYEEWFGEADQATLAPRHKEDLIYPKNRKHNEL